MLEMIGAGLINTEPGMHLTKESYVEVTTSLCLDAGVNIVEKAPTKQLTYYNKEH